ncbi:hypothetical protein EYF80_011891 [Liparis tanakae]|uniref:Uncharacterized protein n=1 Tax=Liparis tanakae TaxID=230148 RepID=A0A4Z2IK36_9TELE|nr:hypothetical protein EYF80_011891 [Liparis tanakae]
MSNSFVKSSAKKLDKLPGCHPITVNSKGSAVLRLALQLLQCIKSTRAGRAVAARWSAAELSQLRTWGLSTKDTCHLESRRLEECTAAAEQPLWLQFNTSFQTGAGKGLQVDPLK